MLWNDSYETWRQFLLRCFNNHAASVGTKEAAVDNFVILHNGHGAQSKTGLHFNPSSVTEANRLKANCATFYRYTEKEEMFEMLPYILGSMREEQRLAFASQYLAPAGLSVVLAESDGSEEFDVMHAADTQTAGCEALPAITRAAIHPTPENLAAAELATDKAIQRFKRTRALLGAARNACKGAKAAIGRMVHRKDRTVA